MRRALQVGVSTGKDWRETCLRLRKLKERNEKLYSKFRARNVAQSDGAPAEHEGFTIGNKPEGPRFES